MSLSKYVCVKKNYTFGQKWITFKPTFNYVMLKLSLAIYHDDKKRYLELHRVILVTQRFERVFHLYMYWY